MSMIHLFSYRINTSADTQHTVQLKCKSVLQQIGSWLRFLNNINICIDFRYHSKEIASNVTQSPVISSPLRCALFEIHEMRLEMIERAPCFWFNNTTIYSNFQLRFIWRHKNTTREKDHCKITMEKCCVQKWWKTNRMVHEVHEIYCNSLCH